VDFDNIFTTTGNVKEQGELTLEKLEQAAALLPKEPIPQTRIVITEVAVVKTDELYFPDSRHRSKRVWKKLFKRYGTQRIYKPAILKVDGDIWVHPVFESELRQKCRSFHDHKNHVFDSMALTSGIPVYYGAAPIRWPMHSLVFFVIST